MDTDWNAKMRTFIRTTLGCGCPDEVLEWIDFTRTDLAQEPEVRLSRIDVGGQLLVYVLEGEDDPGRLSDVLPAIIATGVIEREKREFNRLRVVVATDHPDELRPVAEAIFSASAPLDDKIHFHVVSRMELPFE